MRHPHLLPKRWRHGRIEDIEFPTGTVPWHRQCARWWNYQAVVWVGLGVVYTVIAVITWWPIGVVQIGLVFLAGTRWQQARDSATRHLTDAWQIETQETMASMSTSGMFEVTEALEALRDGPLPPGMKRQDWIGLHDAMAQQLRQPPDEDFQQGAS